MIISHSRILAFTIEEYKQFRNFSDQSCKNVKNKTKTFIPNNQIAVCLKNSKKVYAKTLKNVPKYANMHKNVATCPKTYMYFYK